MALNTQLHPWEGIGSSGFDEPQILEFAVLASPVDPVGLALGWLWAWVWL